MGHFARECRQPKQLRINETDLLGPLDSGNTQDAEMKMVEPEDPLEAFKTHYLTLENQGCAQDAINYLGELAAKGDFQPA